MVFIIVTDEAAYYMRDGKITTKQMREFVKVAYS